MSNNQKIGEIGENIAVKYLEENGYTIVERNKHFSKNCEIDIIAIDKKNTLVFVEVKTRKNDFLGSPLEAITKTKYQNIKTGLYTYLKDNQKYKSFRIDAISIILQPKQTIEHLKNI